MPIDEGAGSSLLLSLLGGEAELINMSVVQLVEVIQIVLGHASFSLCHFLGKSASSLLLHFVSFFVAEVDQVLARDRDGSAVVML